MWWMMAAQAGMSFMQAGQQLAADKAQYKARKAWQTYSNTMVRLSDSMNQNAITTNEIIAQSAFAEQALGIKRSSILTQAKSEVAAAAAGVKGRSVNQSMIDIQRNAAARETERQTSLSNANLAFDQQRLQSRMSAEMQQDYTYLPKPNPATYYLNAAMQTAQSFMSMPQGSGGSGMTSGTSVANPNIAGTRYLL